MANIEDQTEEEVHGGLVGGSRSKGQAGRQCGRELRRATRAKGANERKEDSREARRTKHTKQTEGGQVAHTTLSTVLPPYG